MSEWEKEDYLMISGLQHFFFCPRQWALIHIEQQWQDNRLTAEGEVQHHRAHDEDFKETRKDVMISRGLRVASASLGVSGVCDVVEFTKSKSGVPLFGHRGLWDVCPVEYKHGKDKEDLSDIMQLTCQAMCLEEMLGASISKGCIFYHAIRRRRQIELTEDLREQVRSALEMMHDYARRGRTPLVKASPKCRSCSLKDICLPKLSSNVSVATYLKKYFEGEET